MLHEKLDPNSSGPSGELTLPPVATSPLEFAKLTLRAYCYQELLDYPLEELAARYMDLWSPQYKDTVTQVAQQLGSLAHGKLASVCIPVAGAQEMGKIYRCIESLAYQTISPEQFEIALLVNFSDKDRRERSEDIGQLYAEIERARGDFPKLDTRIATFEFDSISAMTIGYLRSLLCDAVSQRARERPRADDIIMLRFDADTRAIKQQLIESHIRLYHSRPNVLSIQGGLIWSPEGLEANPRLFVALAYHSLQSIVNRHRRVLPDWTGPAASIRGSAYCWIGGYDPSENLAEDHQLAVRLIQAVPQESGLDAVVCGGPSTLVVTSNRRAVAAYKNKQPVDSQWVDEKTRFSCDDHDIRASAEGCALTPVRKLSHFKPSGIDDPFSTQATLEELGVFGLDLDFTKTDGLLSKSEVLRLLHQGYSNENTLIKRMLRTLPDEVLRQRGELPNRIRKIEAASAPHCRQRRFLSHSADWTKELSALIHRNLSRAGEFSSKATVAVESLAQHEKSIRIDLPDELVIRLRLEEQEGQRLPQLSCTISSKSEVPNSSTSRKRTIEEMISDLVVTPCLPRPNIFHSEPSRLVAKRITLIISNSLKVIENMRLLQTRYPKGAI